MRKLQLKNRDSRGPVWLDARLSDGQVPFDDLEPVKGFPRKLEYEEVVEIDAKDFSELLYRRSQPRQSRILWSLYRIYLPIDLEEIKGNIWPWDQSRQHMSRLSNRKKKVIQEIRICLESDTEETIDLWQIGLRFALLLSQHYEYKLSACTFFVLMADQELLPGKFELLGFIPVVSTVIYHVKVGADPSWQAIGNDYGRAVINLVAEILRDIAVKENSPMFITYLPRGRSQ